MPHRSGCALSITGLLAALAACVLVGSRPLAAAEQGQSAKTTAQPQEPALAIRYYESDDEEWTCQAETANFRVYHNSSRKLVTQVARIAERTRAAVQRKWFGTAMNWDQRCAIYLYGNSRAYSWATAATAVSPGHSSFRVEEGHVQSRRIDLNGSDGNLLVAVLPHEVTHTVLAGSFGRQQVPRWADEGIAVLTEPSDRIQRHLRKLPAERGRLLSLQSLMEMPDYPDAQEIGVFYAQSVSLVDFLVAEKGPQVFTKFLADGLRSGYPSALKRHYGYHDFADLEDRWTDHTFHEAAAR